MRILTALTYYHPHWTGLTVYARRIAEGLAARGHEVTVVCSRHDPDLPATEVVAGVRVVRIATVGRVSRAAIAPGLLPALRRELRVHDLLHVHSPMPESGPLVALARRAARPSVVTHQGDVVMPRGLGNRIAQGAMHLTSTAAVRRADAVVTHNLDYAAHSRLLLDRAGPVLAIAPPTVLPPPSADGVAQLRSDLGLDGRLVVGFAGRFAEEKGFDQLLRALAPLRAAVPEVHLLFAGQLDVGYERFHDHCQPLLDEHDDAITSLGLVLDEQRLADFYAACDVFVLPSRTDCFAGVQVEALFSGTPLVTADIPGARDVVRSTGLGRLVDATDTEALASAIEEELALRRVVSRDDVLRHYDPERSIDDYEALLSDVLTGRPPAAASSPRAAAQPDPRWRLSDEQQTEVDRLLANETDMAYRRRVPRIIELLDLKPGLRVLDAGCGMGAVSMVLGRVADVRIVAGDRDLDRLAWAAREGVPASLVSLEVDRLPLPDASVDRVVLAEVLEHVPDDKVLLRELRRVLRPGGVVALSVPHANYPTAWDPPNRVLEAVGAAPIRTPGVITGQWTGHERLYLPGSLRLVLETAGFVVEAIEQQTAYTTPFNHLLVYGVGKPLIEHGLLPERLARSAGRFQSDDDGRWNPVHAATRVLRWRDRRNDHLRGDETRFVGLVARAVAPD